MSSSHSRYCVLEPIASGDYAAVFRGRDNELDRDVAIRQIHAQFLDNPLQLQRYWQEAQLVAKLEHPRIITIYDVIRDRGWLILELMQGSVQQMLGGKPIDLKSFRSLMISMAEALDFLEQRGILHGDVKPSNMLVDKNRRVKLGDFGIARRLANDDGSVVKGTTKYIAPEVVSDQFGPVGPHSDLYSLGFASYELLCGADFESLFPGLTMFGRDRQVAWLMWHAAPDRRLPEIQEVLDGVPSDLARIVQRLCEKEPAKRYPSAKELLGDLTAETPSPAPLPTNQVGGCGERRAARRPLVITTLVISLLLSAILLLLPPVDRKQPAAKSSVSAQSGILQHVDPASRRLYLQNADGSRSEVTFHTHRDLVLLNKNEARYQELQAGDELQVERLVDPQEGDRLIVRATRPIVQQITGKVAALDPAASLIVVSAGESPHAVLHLSVTSSSAITLNGVSVTLEELRPEDQATIAYVDTPAAVVRSIDALRRITLQGTLERIDPPARIVLRLEHTPDAPPVALVVASDCVVTVNGLKSHEGRALSVSELLPGDAVTVSRHREVIAIDAERQVTLKGTVHLIDLASRQLTVIHEGAASSAVAVPLECPILLQDAQPVTLARLRSNDRVIVALDPSGRNAREIQAVLTPDPRNWSLIVAQQNYADPQLAAPITHARDAELIRQVLAIHHRVPAEQLLFRLDDKYRTLAQSIPLFLSTIPEDGRLVVYVVGHLCQSNAGVDYWAPQDFQWPRIAETGLKMSWLVQHLDACPAKEKLLFFDGAAYSEVTRQPSRRSPAEIAASNPCRDAFVIASRGSGETVRPAANKLPGLFATTVAEAFRDKPHVDASGRIDPQGLHIFLSTRMVGPQAPVLQPPVPLERLTAEARGALLQLLELTRLKKSGSELENVFHQAVLLSRDQPDARILYAMAALRDGRRTRDARKEFEAVVTVHPSTTVGYHALAWLLLREGNTGRAMEYLTRAISNLPDSEDAYAQHLFEFAGQAIAWGRLLTSNAFEPSERQLADAISQRGESAKVVTRSGIAKVQERMDEFDRELKERPQDARAIESRKRSLDNYMEFDFPVVERHLQKALSGPRCP